jgi:uncharacterized membrane protein
LSRICVVGRAPGLQGSPLSSQARPLQAHLSNAQCGLLLLLRRQLLLLLRQLLLISARKGSDDLVSLGVAFLVIACSSACMTTEAR